MYDKIHYKLKKKNGVKKKYSRIDLTENYKTYTLKTF